MDRDDQSGTARVRAAVRRSWWPGWIWAIPIAALLVVGWLGVRALTSGGEGITITFDDAHGLDGKGGKIVYRGTNVGQVTNVALTKDGSAVTVSATIQQSAAQFVRSGTRFWLRSANPSLSDLSSLGAVISGPTIVMEPGPGAKADHFTGIPYKPIGPAGDDQAQGYDVSFDGAVGALKTGDPVKLRGFAVGEVKDVGFHVDAKTGALSTSVALELYPSLFHIRDIADPGDPAALRAAVAKLIQEGLRARLERDPPLIGSYGVTLEMEPGAPPPAGTANGQPQIPTASGGGLNSVVSRLGKVPIDRIAQNVLDTTRRADALVSSPGLKDAIVQLDAALAQINKTATTSGPKIDKLIETLRRAAYQLDRAAESARKVAGGTTTQYGLETTMREVTEAARSVRALVSYLDRHPEALIQGRSGG